MARWPRTERRPGGRGSAGALTALAALLGASLLSARADPAAEPELVFQRRGQAVASRALSQLREAVASGDVRVFEPYEQRQVTFRALPFDRVLDAVYGPGWRDREELLFRCRDGYEPSIPVQRVKDHRAWLAFARADQDSFHIRKRESGEVRTIDLSPFYLVWENLDDATVRQEADYGWPYQLVSVDLIRTRDRFGAMAPPEGAPPRVRRGFDAFRVHCSKCHRLHGQGGSLGPELVPEALAARDRDWLRVWIEDPARMAPNARMPALNPALPDRARVVDDILAYLDALAESSESD